MDNFENNESAQQQRLRQEVLNQPSIEAFYAFSDSYRRLAQYKQALSIVHDGLDEFPLSIKLKLLKAQIYFETSELNLSLETYESILEHTRDNVHAVKAMAQILIEQKNFSKAKHLLQGLNPQDSVGDAWVERMLNKINVSHQDISRIHSKTLAQLYQTQGFEKEAASVYNNIGAGNKKPSNQVEKLELYLNRITERRIVHES